MTEQLGVRWFVPAVAAFVCTPWPARAQEDVLQEIVVTAQHRTENLQEVPVAVSALDSEYLSNHNVHSLQDLAGTIPSLVVTNSIGYGLAPITIRGLGGPNGGGSLFTDQPVAVYVDDVYVPTLAQSVSSLVDVGSLQVLRGPQGTLYGRNSTAGAILITSNRPTAQFEAEARATYSSYRNVEGSAFISGPLGTSAVRGRLACNASGGGNWARNTVDGREFGGDHNQGCRASAQFRPSDSLTFDLIGDLSHGTAYPATNSLALLTPAARPPFGSVYVGNPFVRRADFDGLLDSESVSLHAPQFTTTNANDLTLIAKWDAGGINVDSITGWRNMRLTGGQDASPGTAPAVLLGYNTSTQKTRSVSQEVRLSSNDDQARFKWVTGLFYYHQHNDDVIDIVNLQAGPPVASLGGAPPHPIFAGAPSGTTALFTGTQAVDAYAGFADLTYAFTPRWSLTIGGRYSYENKHAAIAQLVQTVTPTIIAGPTLASASCPGSSATCRQSYSDFSPRATVNYKPAKESLLYASYAHGFNSGGFNTFGSVANPTDPANPLESKSETIKSYEIGNKNELLNGHLRVNADVFLADYSNLQIRQAVITGGVAVVNVPKARVKGVELETEYLPIDRLSLTFSGSHLEARITEGTLYAMPSNIGTVITGQNVTVTPQDVSGNSLTRAPKWQFRVSGDYRWPLAVGTVDLSAAYRFESSVYFSETNQDTNAYSSASWREVDLRLALTPQRRNWDIAVFARNVLNDRHITQIAPYNGFPIATLNEPRVVGVTITGRL